DSVWVMIRKSIDTLKSKWVNLMQFCNKVIGNGSSTSFWHERWNGDTCFSVRFHRLFNLEHEKDISVAQKLHLSDCASSFRRRPRGGLEESQWNEMVQVSARKEIDKHLRVMSSVPTRWSKLMPIKVNVFIWRMLDKLPTRSNLFDKGVDVPCVLCPICDSKVESRNHLFFGCSLVSEKKMHFLLSSMSLVYVLTTPVSEDGGDDETMEQIKKRAKWDNDDYDSLEAKYITEDASSKKFLVSNFTIYKITDSRPVLEQYNKLLGILGRFTQHKMNMDEDIQVSCIIDKLPLSWKDFKHTLKHKKEELTLVELGSHLRIEESLRMYNDNKGKRKHHDNTKADPNKKSKVTCWKCGKPRHLKKDCKSGKVSNKANGPGTNGSVDGSTNSLKGATIYMCKDRCWFKTYESLNDGSILHMVNESTTLVHGCGCVDLMFGSGKIVSLFNVLHVPNIRKNLDSSSVLNNCGYKQVIEYNKFVLSKHGVFTGFGYLSNHMFRLNIVNDNIGSAFMSTSKLNDSILWHARLGHVHFKRMQDMSKDRLIPAFDMNTEKWEVSTLILYFQSVGIIHETTTPYTPQQNGISERKNRVLKEMVNTMLSYSGLSQGFWGEAMLTACYLLNMVPNKRNMINPYELWTKRKPNLNYLRVWGCRAVVRLPNPKLKTLGKRGIECIFVGYAEHSKAFRFFVIEPNDSIAINSIIESSDAIFDENRFSSVPRLSLRIPNGTEDIGGSVVPEEVTEEDDPKTFDEAMKSQDVAFWKEAINDKIDSIDFHHGNQHLDVGISTLQVDLTKEFLSSRFSMKDMGEADVILVSTSMDTSEKLMPNNGQTVSQLEYSRVIGCLMYAITYTKPDIAFDVDKLSRYTSNPGTQHWQAIQRVLKYLKKTMDYILTYIGYPSVLEGYTYASWISNTEDNSSSSSWVFLLGGGAISWAFKKQTCITSSTMESEFVALATAGKEAEWLKNLLIEILLWSKPIAHSSIRCDSVATLAKAYNQMYNRKSRHLGVRHNMIRELIMNGVISIEFVRSQQNLADHLTNGLARDLVIKFAE
ncbi:zinc finger, CCHC-type containing protein, partial [Tanacetum coccineum]